MIRRFLVVAGVTVILGLGLWLWSGLRTAICTKNAAMWMRHIVRFAVEVERLRRTHDTYPVAFTLDELKSRVPSAADSSLIQDGYLRYYSDGRHYVIFLRLVPDGPMSSRSFTFEFRDGRWISWPDCLPPERLAEMEQLLKEGTKSDGPVSQTNYGMQRPVSRGAPLALASPGAAAKGHGQGVRHAARGTSFRLIVRVSHVVSMG